MTEYNAPVRDMRFVLRHVADLEEIAALPGYEDATPDLVDAALDEAAKWARDVVAPLNRPGDEEGSKLVDGEVRTPAGFKEAYEQFVEGGWNGVPFEPDYGGQGLPWTVSTALTEMWDSASTAWSLCPMLTVGAIEAIQAHGTQAQKDTYLPKLISGEWTGTMNLTEPQAGSDVGALRTRAVPDGDCYRITGQKIFITYGDQDYTDNIVHLVLARLPDAPKGTKGISLFIVPKFLVGEDGSLGERNDVQTLSLEHKLGIHASPTCVLGYGEEGEGAVGYLLGEENNGMACMFTMMNNARLNVGLLGLATAERAYQQARDFACERVQGRDMLTGDDNVVIFRHPDVRRMLMSMKASTEAMRALTYYAAAGLDRAKRHPDDQVRAAAQAEVDILIPIVKAWNTDVGCEVTSTGVQVHGGMGFIEETGAAQHYRDSRIHPIYEGTNGIQANDLLGRKIARDGGAAARALLATMHGLDNELGSVDDADIEVIRRRLNDGIAVLGEATDWMIETFGKDMGRAAVGAVPYLHLWGNVTAGWLMARAAVAARKSLADGANGDAAFCEAKIKTARFFADQYLTRSSGLRDQIVDAGDGALSLAEDAF